MRLVTFGCSNTFGSGLEDQTQAWPYILAASLLKECDNQAIPGSSNLQILNTILNYKFDSTDTVVIMWSLPNRDFIFPNEQLGVWQDKPIIKDWLNTHSEIDLITRSWYHIHHGNLYLKDKKIPCYNFAVDYSLLNKHKPSYIDTHLYNCRVDLYKFLDKAKDKTHPGIKAHKNISENIRKFIDEN